MFTRRKSIDENQSVLANFVKNDKLVGEITGNSSNTPRTKSSAPVKKRSRPLSPQDSTKSDQNKRAHIEHTMEPSEQNNNASTPKVDNSANIILNPELTELKKQIFAGFETLLVPLRQEIRELKDDQKILFDSDKFTTETKIERKFVQTEEKHRKLESRISLLEDQLLEKNIIFQGVHEEE